MPVDSFQLRRGNYVSYKGAYYRVNEIMVDTLLMVGYPDSFFPIAGVEPIPLDAEMLKKAGFTYFINNKSWQWDSDIGFSIWGRDGIFNVYCDSNEIGYSFRYLHQLQNIIHSLTGTELTINL